VKKICEVKYFSLKLSIVKEFLYLRLSCSYVNVVTAYLVQDLP